jgi:predicted lipid-binding transport protein (Tim44 family)
LQTNLHSRWCVMTMSWNQNKYACMTHSERAVERNRRVSPKSLPRIKQPSPNRVDAESLPAACNAPSKMGFIRWDLMLAALAGVMIFFIFNTANIGILASALTVTAILAVVGFAHYLLWGRVRAGRDASEAASSNAAPSITNQRSRAPRGEF